MELKILKKYKCHTNEVCLAQTPTGDKVVYKKYSNSDSARREADILSKISVTGYAPKVLESGTNYNINEYVEGDIFMDLFVEFTMSDDDEKLIKLANELSVYLQIFYSLTDGWILSEINFNNFIIKDGRCYGIDYDSATEGLLYTDIAGIVANACYYAVGGLQCGFPFIKRMLTNFHLDVLDIINDVRKYLEKMGKPMDIDRILETLLRIGDKK